MADDTLKPMTDDDATPPPATTEFKPAAGLDDVEFETTGGTETQGAPTDEPQGDLREKVKDGAARYGTDVADRARAFADTGKAKATDALGQLSTMLGDAAGQVDDKLGSQYGDYARNAAGTVQRFADQLQSKNVDDLIGDARDYVRKSPGAAIGIAAALGFVLARVIQSGVDAERA